MGLRIVLDSDKKATGIFIPLSEFHKLRKGLKANSPLNKMMDELTYPQEAINDRRAKINGHCTIEEQEIMELYNLEDHYIKLFLQNKPVYYKDERCTEETYIIRAEPDGIEFLINYDWNTKDENIIGQLAKEGEGSYSYLLSDARYLKGKYTL